MSSHKDFLEIMDALKATATNADRTKQKLVGASQLGGCPYHLGLAMLGSFEEQEPEEPGMAAWIGTAVHAHIENTLVLEGAVQETKVKLFDIPEYGIVGGHVDMHWRDQVWDWKVLGKTSLQKYQLEYRRKPNQIPNITYRAQLHLYGYGLIQQGYEVTDVNIVAIPKTSNRFEDIVHFTETYNPNLVEAVIPRAKEIWKYASDGRLEDLPKDIDNCYDCSSLVKIKLREK